LYVVPFSSYLTLNNHDLAKLTEGLGFRGAESLRAVSYSPSIVTMAVSLTFYKLFSIKE